MTGPSDLPPLRTGKPAPAALVERRAQLEAMPPLWPARADVRIETRLIAGREAVIVEPERAARTLLYVHGGGFRLGSARGWTGFASALAVACEARVVLAEYRLAPEAPFPAALHDIVSCWGEVGDGPVFVGGDSAGGGLATSLVLHLATTGARLPEGLILFSPWLDLGLSGESVASRAGRDRFFPPEAATIAAEQYLGGHDARDPLASPLFGDPGDFPPVLLFCGSEEILLTDATRFAGRLALAGVTTEAHFVTGMQHVWPVAFPDLAETKAAIAAAARFMGCGGPG